jgi:pyrimidine operon attenuation protein/uracil phosphoribosyltransferase
MTAQKNLVLEDSQVRHKIRRMAFEIFENNFEEKSIVLAGIEGQGYALAQLLEKELKSVSRLQVSTAKVKIDKASPEDSDVTLSVDADKLEKKTIIIVDDVLNTGRTLAYAMKPFLCVEVKKIEVAVLVNRSHPLFPIQPSYTGYELSTTLTEHVEVVLGKKSGVYLH